MPANFVTTSQISFQDIPQLVKMHLDPSIYTFDPDTEKVSDEEIAKNYIQKAHQTWQEGTTYIFSIYNQENEFVGFITLRDVIKDLFAKIGFAIAKEQRGKGYVTAVIKKTLEYAGDILGIKTIEASVHIDNIPSQKALLKNRFVKIDRQNCIGKFKNNNHYSIF